MSMNIQVPSLAKIGILQANMDSQAKLRASAFFKVLPALWDSWLSGLSVAAGSSTAGGSEVSVKTMEKGAATAKVEMTVTPAETVRSVKEKVAAAQLIAFPEHKLVCGGEKLDEKKTLGDCGVTEASAVEFVLEATEDSVVTQLKELLKSRDLTCDELGLLYCYKHGVSTNQALKTIGIEMKLADFIKDRKEFVLEGGKISMVRDDTSLKPLSVADQLEQILKENGPTMEVTALCSKFIQKFHVSVANVVQMRPLDFIMKEKTKFALVGNNMVTLKEFEKQEKAKQEKAKVEGSALRMARSRSPQTSRAPPPAPWRQQEAPKRRSPSPRARPATQQIEQNEDLYQELHTKISSRSFNSRVAQALSSIKEIVEQHCFLNVVDVVKGGSVGKGTAITDCEDAELVSGSRLAVACCQCPNGLVHAKKAIESLLIFQDLESMRMNLRFIYLSISI